MTLYRLSPARIAVVVAFALSCFGIAMYLWSTFGGAVPLRPKGYRVWVPLRSALILPTNAPEGRKASSIVGGEFLVRFAGDVPWAHLDIAGTAWDVGRPYAAKGGCGVMVRTLVALAERAAAA